MKKRFNLEILNKFNERECHLEYQTDYKYSFIPSQIFGIVINIILLIYSIMLLPFAIILALFDYCIDVYIYCVLKYRTKNRTKFIKKAILDHEKNLLKENKFYSLHRNHAEIPNNIEGFITEFFIRYNNRYNTHDADDKYICDTGRRRSVGDIFLICKYYFPDCTLEEVQTILLILIQKREISGSYCNTIYKYVYYRNGSNQGYNNKLEFIDHFTFKDLQQVYNLEHLPYNSQNERSADLGIGMMMNATQMYRR